MIVLNWCGYGTDDGCGYVCSEGTAYCHHCGRDPVEKVEVVLVSERERLLEALREIVRVGSSPRDSMESLTVKYRALRQAMLDVAYAALREEQQQ